MNDLKTFLSSFLDIINYPDNKQEFINKLLSIIYLETVTELIKALPQDKRIKIEESFKTAITPELVQEVVSASFDKDIFEQALQQTSQKVFAEYLQTINGTLSDEQKAKLQEYFDSVKPQSTA